MRVIGIWLSVLCVSCQSLVPLEPHEETNGAMHLWEQGQEAMKKGRRLSRPNKNPSPACD